MNGQLLFIENSFVYVYHKRVFEPLDMIFTD
jgi:hypothetical protein